MHLQLGRTTTADPLPWPLVLQPDAPPAYRAALPRSYREAPNDMHPRPTESSLLQLALAWLREDRVLRVQQDAERGVKRGRAERAPETTDAKRFFSQYDYYANYTR